MSLLLYYCDHPISYHHHYHLHHHYHHHPIYYYHDYYYQAKGAKPKGAKA